MKLCLQHLHFNLSIIQISQHDEKAFAKESKDISTKLQPILYLIVES